MVSVNPHGPAQNGTAEPYRVFFPLGLLFGLLGVGIWAMYDAGFLNTVPGWWHIDLQIQGFLGAFVFGFLFTAVPRFSGASPMSSKELLAYAFVFTAGNLLTVFAFRNEGRVAFFLMLLLTVRFILVRFRHRQRNPPEEFVFVGLGLLSGLAASGLRILPWVSDRFVEMDLIGRRLLTEGMMVLLILGVGGKLFPLFFGLAKRDGFPVQISASKTWTKRHTLLLGLGLMYLFSFVLEYAGTKENAFWLRALVGTAIFFYAGRLHRWPREKGILVKSLYFSAWAVLLTLWGVAFHDEYRVATLHVMFVYGFSLMILCVATRVTLSHGGWGTEAEKTSKSLLLAGFFLLTAVLVRSFAPLIPEKYFRLLGIASWAWVLAMIIWGVRFVPMQTFLRLEVPEKDEYQEEVKERQQNRHIEK